MSKFYRDAAEALQERVQELEAAIQKHQLRKVHATCTPLPGRECKYGCADVDRRLWSVLDYPTTRRQTMDCNCPSREVDARTGEVVHAVGCPLDEPPVVWADGDYGPPVIDW